MENKRDYEVYVIRRSDKIDPIEPELFQPLYFGKGKENNGRRFSHRKDAKYCLKHPEKQRDIKVKIIIKLWAQGLDIIEETYIGGLTEEGALFYEMEAIKRYGRIDLGTGCLANLTDGGEGVSGWVPTEEWKQKQRELNSGENNPMFGTPGPMLNRKHSYESKNKMSECQIGENNSFYNRKHSEESKNKMSESKSGENHWNWGNTTPEETKVKIGKGNTGKIVSEESKQNMSKGQIKRYSSEEEHKR